VLGSGLQGTRTLPGGTILIGHSLIEDEASPDVVAGYVLAERARAQDADALVPLLKWSGISAVLTLLTTGQLPAERTNGYVEALLVNPDPPPPAAPLIALARAADVPITPYVRAARLDEALSASLIAGDPYAARPPPGPVMPDMDWVALQGICGN
jgi:hypothetical protein